MQAKQRIGAFLLTCMSLVATFAIGQNLTDRITALGQPLITNISSKVYQAHPNNFDVIQDKDGVLYVANLWGVLQYDGTLWRRIRLPGGVSCTSLSLDSDGTIYAAGRNTIGYLTPDSIGGKKYTSLTEQIQPADRQFDEIWKIAISKKFVLFAGYTKLFCYEKQTKKLVKVRDFPWHVYQLGEKTYVTANDGLFNYSDAGLVQVPNTTFLGKKYVTGITTVDSRLLIATYEAGFHFFDGKKFQRWNVPLNETLRSYNVTRIHYAGNNRLIVSTELNGVIICDLEGNVVSEFNKNKGLASNMVSGFYLDRQNILWMTTYNGVAYARVFDEIGFINENAGVSGIPHSSAIHNDSLFLATSEGLYAVSLDNNAAKKIERRYQGLVWNVAVIDGELFCGQAIVATVFRNGKFETFYDEGTWMFLHEKREQKIFIGTYTGLHVAAKVNGQWKYSHRVKGYQGSTRNFVRDRLGDIWITWDNRGIIKLRLNAALDSVVQQKTFAASNGLPHEHGVNITKWNDEILIATQEGIFTYDYDHEQIVSYDKINTVIAAKGYKAIKKIVPATETELWLADHNGSLLRIVKTDHAFEVVSATDMLRNNLLTDFEHLNPLGENLLVGTVQGFAIKNAKGGLQDHIPRIFVSRIESAGTILHDGTSTPQLRDALPYNRNSLQFTFGSDSYVDPNTNKYQYFLEGFANETDWSAPSSLPRKEYTNLQAGDYKLHARLINGANRVSDEALVAFTILPPWYESTWAYFLYAALFLAFNYFFFKGVRRKIEREKQRTAREEQHERWVKEKEWEEVNLKNRNEMLALQQEKLVLEQAALAERELLLGRQRQKDLQVSELEREKLEADIRHKNSELSMLTMHIAQKNEMIHQISNQVVKTLAATRDDAVIRKLKEIKDLLQRDLGSDQEWERFTNHFDTVHEGFLKRLKHQYPDLGASMLKLCAFIKMRLSSKQIASLMNTAPESVLKARYRLRTKFGLSKEQGLEEFLNEF
ncbi:MAG TPA: triple tyrosine motif-containing protein [Chryseosolibacter sp.]|nr:triple tyrosine motif-containing protein [Chryseosolibacter sp.]